jgi:hypothetical protein
MNKVVIFEYDDEIRHFLPMDVREKALEALNIHLVGTNNINIDSPSGIKENPEVTKHSNYGLLNDVHFRMFANSIMRVRIRIYSDGTRDMIPREKP